MCFNCEDNYNGRIVVTPPKEGDSISVIGIEPIKVNKSKVGDTTQYVVSLYQYKAPTVYINVSPKVVEFGKEFTATFVAGYAAGSESITNVTITPDEGIEVLPATKFYLTRTPTTKNETYKHTITVLDSSNKETSTFVEMKVNYRYLKGYVTRGDTNAIITNSVVADSLTQAFGQKSMYTNTSASSVHFCWLAPIGDSTKPTPLGEGGLPFETIEAGHQSVDGIGYTIYKTVNFYPKDFTAVLQWQ